MPRKIKKPTKLVGYASSLHLSQASKFKKEFKAPNPLVNIYYYELYVNRKRLSKRKSILLNSKKFKNKSK